MLESFLSNSKVHDGGKKPAAPKGKQMSKSEVNQALEDMSGVKKAVCKKVYEGFLELIFHEMEKRKTFALAGVCKFVTKRRKARKAGKGINPFTGEPCVIKARPACNVPRVRVLKALKDAVA
jgi:DNA-binding protein HU-beta